MLEHQPPSRSDAGRGLEICLVCGGDFVNPVDWDALEGHRFWMLLRCGACETWRDVTVSDAAADRFEDALDERTRVLERTLERLDRERMEDEVEAFVAGLHDGRIGPAHFAA
jgi:hypothetical protein